MIWLLILLIITIASVAMVIAYWLELRRVSGFIRSRPSTSNMRLNRGAPLPASSDLIDAVNQQIDQSADQELAIKQEEADLLKGLANLSHDIRTPLAGAKGYVQLASAEEDDEERARLLASAESRLDAMRGMLDQLFDYTKALSPQDENIVEEIDAVALLSSVLAGHHPSFLEANLEPKVDLGAGSLIVLAEPRALRRIFENIVSNILMHGTDNVSIERTGSMMRFSNKMRSGDPFDSELAFKRFYRSDPSRNTAGAGLGLAVVKELCDAMQADVSVDAHDGDFALTIEFPDSSRERSDV